MLDERLIDTLPLQDPIRFGAVAGRGRLVARRAFEPLLPPFLTANPSKNREGFEAELAAMEQALPGQVGAALEGLKALEGNLHPRGGRPVELAGDPPRGGNAAAPTGPGEAAHHGNPAGPGLLAAGEWLAGVAG